MMWWRTFLSASWERRGGRKSACEDERKDPG